MDTQEEDTRRHKRRPFAIIEPCINFTLQHPQLTDRYRVVFMGLGYPTLPTTHLLYCSIYAAVATRRLLQPEAALGTSRSQIRISK